MSNELAGLYRFLKVINRKKSGNVSNHVSDLLYAELLVIFYIGKITAHNFIGQHNIKGSIVFQVRICLKNKSVLNSDTGGIG